MPRKHLTDKEKKRIVRRIVDKKQSVARVARKFDRSEATIRTIVARSAARGTVKRKLKLDKRAQKRIRALVDKYPSTTTKQIQKKLALDVSLSTIHVYLASQGYVASSSRKKPLRVRNAQ